jgi:hypothetical protein
VLGTVFAKFDNIENPVFTIRVMDRQSLVNSVKGESVHNLLIQRSCPHCGATKLRFCGYSISTIYNYFECQECHKYVEYRFTSIAQIISYLLLVPIFIILVIGAVLVVNSRNLALLFLTCAALLFTFAIFRYGWAGQEATALNELPRDRIVIPVSQSKIRILISIIFLSILLGYIALFIFNMVRQQ